jgi:cytoskeletal protein RodZ
MLSLQYNGEVLSKKRDELKLKVDDIATELCLSVQQVHAIENNLNGFYQSNKLKQAVIKRYCLFLNIDMNTVISEYEEDKSDANLEELKKKYFSDDSDSAKSSAYKAEKTQFQHWSDIERFIDKQSRLK